MVSSDPRADRLYIEAHGDAALLADRIGHLGRVSYSGTGTAKDPQALWFEVRPARRIDAALAREKLVGLGIDPCVDLVVEVAHAQGHVLARQPTFFALDAWDAMRKPSTRISTLTPDAADYRWRLVFAPTPWLAGAVRSMALSAARVSAIVGKLRANAVVLPVTAVAERDAVRVLDGHHRVAAFESLKRDAVPTLLGHRRGPTDGPFPASAG